MLTALDAPDHALDDHERRVVEQIREHGWFGFNILEEPGHNGFRYTINFWNGVGFPELIVFSLKISHDIFWNVYRDLKAGMTFPVGRPVSDVLGEVDVMFLPVDKRHYPDHLGWDRWFYAGDGFPCLQLVYPDLNNVFPWEEGFDPAWIGRQDDLTAADWGSDVRNA